MPQKIKLNLTRNQLINCALKFRHFPFKSAVRSPQTRPPVRIMREVILYFTPTKAILNAHKKWVIAIAITHRY